MAKLKIQRHERGQLVRLPLRSPAEKENPVAPEWRHGALCCLEAAGIEPASESLPSFDPTCVVRALLRPEGSHGRDPTSRAWKDLATSGPGTLGSQPAL